MWPLRLLLITSFAFAGNPHFDDLSFFGTKYKDIFPSIPKENLLTAATNNEATTQEVGTKTNHHNHALQGKTSKEGYTSGHESNNAAIANHDNSYKKNKENVSGNKHKKNHDEASHYKKHHESRRGHKAAKFGEKKGHKRGHKTKGYHNKFHKDEYHREHKFYDDFHKSGHHSKSGEHLKKHNSEEGGHKNGKNHKSGYRENDYSKKSVVDKGKLLNDHRGQEKEDGRKEHHKYYNDYGKKDSHNNGKHYGYHVVE